MRFIFCFEAWSWQRNAPQLKGPSGLKIAAQAMHLGVLTSASSAAQEAVSALPNQHSISKFPRVYHRQPVDLVEVRRVARGHHLRNGLFRMNAGKTWVSASTVRRLLNGVVCVQVDVGVA